MIKPEFIFGGTESPVLTIVSPDGTKSATISLTNDGVLTCNGIPIVTTDTAGYEELTYANNRQTKSVIWKDNTKTSKIRERDYVYEGNKLTQIITYLYDLNGNILSTQTENLTYDASNRVIQINRGTA